ncbi:hypothetical protein [Haloarchaeobius amylolyticus]|uniref:hypothetical protein n=1 Tax=Haloarchaeobius amylolyticus TaxID=1198296 RepID=UPI00227064D1|nr:hypothetical protein [Haloarchaeobius amylolyticus]
MTAPPTDTDTPELPTLDPGVTLLDADERVTGALQSLVLDHVLLEGGRGTWLDANGHATTSPMARLAPSMRALDRIDVARAFTPWQHQSLLFGTPGFVDEDTVLLVLPAFDAFYREDDLRRGEGEAMLDAGLDIVEALADEHEVPILLTRERADSFSQPIHDLADEVLECERTRFGPRFSGGEFETLVYPLENGDVQTTLAFWERVLQDRHAALVESPQPEVSLGGTY